MKLDVKEIERHGGLRTMRIGGLTNEELSELKSCEHFESRDFLLDMLDSRNGNLGTVWLCGYGVYGHWFDNEYAYINIGTSCD